MSTQFGIMQGRLVPPDQGRFQSFPRKQWRDEFPNAVAASIDYIEWIVDAYGADVNPILSDEGLLELDALKREYGIATPTMKMNDGWIRSQKEQPSHSVWSNW